MPISPPEIPFGIILISLDFNLELLGHFSHNFILTICIVKDIPETLMRIRSKRMCWVQLGTNLGIIGSHPLSSLSLSL